MKGKAAVREQRGELNGKDVAVDMRTPMVDSGDILEMGVGIHCTYAPLRSCVLELRSWGRYRRMLYMGLCGLRF